MIEVYDVTGGDGGTATLIIGDKKSALIDSGMSFSGEKLVKNIENKLKGRTLDYVFLTHSHYDHIGGLPEIRNRYKNVVVLAHSHAEYVLKKDSAYKLICDLSENASHMFKDDKNFKIYDKEYYKVDEIIKEGDSFDLGGDFLEVYETPGHTKCSLSFFLKNTSLLFPSETTGVASKTSYVLPCYIVGCDSAIKSCLKLKALNAKNVWPSHSIKQNTYKSKHFFDESIFSIKLSRRFIITLYEMGIGEEEILLNYTKVYEDKTQGENQPSWAFKINAGGQIKTVIKEYEEGLFDLENDRLL